MSLNTPTTETRNRRRLLIAAAAAVVVIGIAGIALAFNADDDQSSSPAPTTTVALTTTVAPTTTIAQTPTIAPTTTVATYSTDAALVSEADTAATAAFETVNNAYDLYNLGKMLEWIEVRDSGSVWPSAKQRTDGMQESLTQEQEKYDAGGRYVDTECVSNGLGDWPEVADDGLATGYYFTCEAVFITDYENPEAFVLYESFNWVVNDGVVVAVNSTRRYVE